MSHLNHYISFFLVINLKSFWKFEVSLTQWPENSWNILYNLWLTLVFKHILQQACEGMVSIMGNTAETCDRQFMYMSTLNKDMQTMNETTWARFHTKMQQYILYTKNMRKPTTIAHDTYIKPWKFNYNIFGK